MPPLSWKKRITLFWCIIIFPQISSSSYIYLFLSSWLGLITKCWSCYRFWLTCGAYHHLWQNCKRRGKRWGSINKKWRGHESENGRGISWGQKSRTIQNKKKTGMYNFFFRVENDDWKTRGQQKKRKTQNKEKKKKEFEKKQMKNKVKKKLPLNCLSTDSPQFNSIRSTPSVQPPPILSL